MPCLRYCKIKYYAVSYSLIIKYSAFHAALGPSILNKSEVILQCVFLPQYILHFLYKVLTGQIKEMDDIREDDDVAKLAEDNMRKNGEATQVNG